MHKTTNEFKTPTTKTRISQSPAPDRTRLLFWDHPSGEAKLTGTPINRRKDKKIKPKTDSWKMSSINKRKE